MDDENSRRAAALVAAAATIVALIAGFSSLSKPAHGASFDCAKAATASDRAICANRTLSALDSQLGAIYAQRVAREPAIRQVERAWIAARTAGCGKSVACLAALTNAQIAWLRSGAAQLPAALPGRVGACSQTTITDVGTRLEGAPGSGSQVSEANGAVEVSYEQIPAADASRRGDAAVVCLISLPQDCPPGDNRGKEYAVGNMRTLRAWSAPDAEHMCGGA
jgi:uncharacterized protein